MDLVVRRIVLLRVEEVALDVEQHVENVDVHMIVLVMVEIHVVAIVLHVGIVLSTMVLDVDRR